MFPGIERQGRKGTRLNELIQLGIAAAAKDKPADQTENENDPNNQPSGEQIQMDADDYEDWVDSQSPMN